MEEWRSVVGYVGEYDVSSFGSVKSLRRTVKMVSDKCNKTRTVNERILKQYTDRYGYKIVCLSGKYLKVHRLVATAFLKESKLTVNHKDGNKLNNNIENLEFLTASENSRHAHASGLMRNRRGAKRKLSESDKSEINRLRGRLTIDEIGVMFNIHPMTCYKIWKIKSL